MRRLLVPNLEAELTWALAAGDHRAPPRGLKVGVDPRLIGPRALLFGFLGRPGDRLRMPVGLVDGDLRFGRDLEARDLRLVTENSPEDVVLPWARTERTAESSAAALALRLNDRRQWAPLDPARHLGVASSPGELSRGLRALGPDEGWVAKGAWSAAGRLRLRGTGPSVDAAQSERAARLLALAGGLVVERWTPHLREWGVALEVTDDGVELRGVHRAYGHAAPDFLVALAVDDAEYARLIVEARRLGEVLRAEGYRGPAGVDLRRGPGESALGIGDVNVRHTFGHVLHASGLAVLAFASAAPGATARALVVDREGAPTGVWGLDAALDLPAE